MGLFRKTKKQGNIRKQLPKGYNNVILNQSKVIFL